MKTKNGPDLKYAFDQLNRQLFGGVLLDAVVAYNDRYERGFTASYLKAASNFEIYGHRIALITINQHVLKNWPDLETLTALAHEMVHHWQVHFGVGDDVKRHDDEWADKLESIGLMPSTTGHPGGDRTGYEVLEYLIAGGKFDFAATALFDGGFHFEMPGVERPDLDPDCVKCPLNAIRETLFRRDFKIDDKIFFVALFRWRTDEEKVFQVRKGMQHPLHITTNKLFTSHEEKAMQSVEESVAAYEAGDIGDFAKMNEWKIVR